MKNVKCAFILIIALIGCAPNAQSQGRPALDTCVLTLALEHNVTCAVVSEYYNSSLGQLLSKERKDIFKNSLRTYSVEAFRFGEDLGLSQNVVLDKVSAKLKRLLPVLVEELGSIAKLVKAGKSPFDQGPRYFMMCPGVEVLDDAQRRLWSLSLIKKAEEKLSKQRPCTLD